MNLLVLLHRAMRRHDLYDIEGVGRFCVCEPRFLPGVFWMSIRFRPELPGAGWHKVSMRPGIVEGMIAAGTPEQAMSVLRGAS